MGFIQRMFNKELPDISVTGWDLFNNWVEDIKQEQGLTSKEKVYILKRIASEVEKKPSESFWNEKPLALRCVFQWNRRDFKKGVTKASDLRH